MSLATYAGLRVAIANVLQRSDLVAVIPDLITLAEAQINQRLDARQQDTTASIATVASTESASLPTGVINVRAMQITSTTPYVTLDYVTPEQLRLMDAYGATGQPNKYTVVGLTMYMRPIPDAIYTITCTYKGTIPALSDAVTSNYVLTAYPDVYLYGALSNAGPYINDDVRVAKWQQAFVLALQGANSSDWFTGSSMAVRSDSRTP